MQYYVYGPCEMARDDTAISRSKGDKQKFWALVEQEDEGLSDACGCYLFVLRRRVWYVGLAEKQSFKQEVFQNHKLLLYGEALRKANGRAQFFFLAKVTPGNRFAKPSKARGHKDIRFLEKLLIGTAIRRNNNVRNVKDTKLLRGMCAPGFLNKKRGEGRAVAVQGFKIALGV